MGKTLHASATTNGSFYSMSPYPQMVGYFAEAVHLDRSNSRAYYNLATVYYLMGDYKRAESFLIIAKNLGTEESLVRPGVLETNDKQRFGEEFMLGRQR
ncbi:MAG: tetratricopeptide repeat protein [Dehalococcoidia bacterium]|nr:tetratricopeptide repeat protein [Dehalococcoidia bacterium]